MNKGQEDLFPTNPDLAAFPGRIYFYFVSVYALDSKRSEFLDFQISQISKFDSVGSQISAFSRFPNSWISKFPTGRGQRGCMSRCAGNRLSDPDAHCSVQFSLESISSAPHPWIVNL